MLPGFSPVKPNNALRAVGTDVLPAINASGAHTWTAKSIGIPSQDRLVVAFFNSSNNAGAAGNFTGVTFNGVAADGFIGPTGTRSATCMAWKWMPAGTTCDIVATSNVTCNTNGEVIAIYGLQNINGAATATAVGSAGSGGPPTPGPIAVPKGGLLVTGVGTSTTLPVFSTSTLAATDSSAEFTILGSQFFQAANAAFSETITGGTGWYGWCQAAFF